MNSHCPKCDRELLRAAADPSDAKTISRSLLVCTFCGSATLFSESVETLSFDQATAQQQIAHFRLERLLGSGGFGDVWLALDTKLGRLVALKLSKARRRETSTLVFEAQTAASLRHPNVVSVHEVGEVDGQVYIASDLIDGMTLGDLLSAGKPPLDRTIEIMIPVARALHFAHTRGVYHRDVKPANILLDHAGQPYVTDFGLAKRANDASSSGEGRMVGTVRYMSPEQAVGNFGETDGRSDVYALGVTLFEMLTGETPFRGNAQAILHQKAFDDPPSPRKLEPNLPKDLETICLKCLEREPGKRFQSAGELAEELERYAANEPIHSRPISRLERSWRWCKKRPAISGLLAGLIFSLSTGLIGVSYFWGRSMLHEAAARQSLYRSWMNMAAIHLRTGDTDGVRDLLARVADEPAMHGMRGFEWNYFNALMEPIKPIGHLEMPIFDVAVSHDGDYCAATGGDHEVHVWDVRSRELVRTLATDGPSFRAIDFSPTTAQLAAGSVDGFVRIYDPLVGTRMIRPLLHGPPVTILTYAPDGKSLAAAGKAGAVRIWDPADGNLLAEIPTGKKEATTEAVRFSPDGGKLYVASTDGRVRVWDMAALSQLAPREVPTPLSEYEMPTGSLTALSVSHDGDYLFAGNYYGITSSLSLADGTTSLYKSRWGIVSGIEPIGGTDLLAVATNDGLLHLYDHVTKSDIHAIHTHGLAEARLKRASNGKVLVIGSGDGSVSAIQLAKLPRPSILWHPDKRPVRSIEFIGHAEKLLACYDDGTLWLWDTDKGSFAALIDEITPGQRLIAVHPDREYFVTGTTSSIEVWDTKTLTAVQEISGTSPGITAIQFSSTGRLMAVAFRDGRIRIYRTHAWIKPILEIDHSQSPATAVEFSPDDNTLAIARDDRQFERVEISTGRLQTTVALHYQPSTLAYCADTDEFAIGTHTGELVFCAAQTGHEQDAVAVKAHTGRIHAMVKMPDSPTLITAGRDKVLRLWNLPSKELNTVLADHFRQVFTVAVSADGKTIASGSLEGDVRIWRSR